MKVPILTAALAVVLASTASAQYRPPIRPPVPPPTPSVRPAPVASRPPAPPAPRVRGAKRTQILSPQENGNSSASNRPQHVYVITRRDTNTGMTGIHKVGITGGTVRPGGANTGRPPKTIIDGRRTYTERGLTQVRQLNREAALTGEAATYSTRLVRRIDPQPAGGPTSRQLALALEKKVVTSFDVKTGGKPAGNVLPNSYPFSRLPAK